MTYALALAGNQNAGKTTLFNLLTGEDRHTGNWPGVTVDIASGRLRRRFLPEAFARDEVVVYDLPGVYTLSPYSPEEAAARAFILDRRPDAVIDVADAANLPRNLYLTHQLAALNVPLVVALNMMDALEKGGGHVDIPALADALNLACVGVCARDGRGVPLLIEAALTAAQAGKTSLARHNPPRPPADMAAYAEAAARRYACIERALDKAGYRARGGTGGAAEHGEALSSLDRALTHRVAAYPLLCATLTGVLLLSFGTVGGWAARVCGQGLAGLLRGVDTLLQRAGTGALIRGLLVDGALNGVCTVVGFLPPILLFFTLISLLEDTGWMARAALLMDAPMRRIGLTGRGFIPLLSGLGCTVPAVMSVRALPTAGERRRVALLVPYISCGAKAPVYLYMAAACFPQSGGLVTVCMYLLGALAAAGVSAVIGRVQSAPPAAFIMELPPFRLPTLRGTLRVLREKTRDFLSRAFTVVFLCSLALWFLRAFTCGLKPASDASSSALYALGGAVARVFAPLGFASPDAAAALIAGAFAKENIVSALQIAGGAQAVFPSPAAALSFCAFAALYQPCVAACAVLRREIGGAARCLLCVLLQTALAWCAALLIYHTALWL